MDIYIYIRDLTLYFEDGTVISGIEHDPEDSKEITPGA
jgi:hypothetical protein